MVVLITGTQRTGTSFLSNYCKQLGYDLGTQFWHSEINGGLESPDICMFYRKELDDKNFPFDDFTQSIEQRKYIHLSDLDKHYKVLKFSYLLMNPSFVDIWYKYRGNVDKLVILVRNAEEIVLSKTKTSQRRARFTGDSNYLHLNAEQIKTNFYDSLCKLMDYKIRFTLLKFPNFLADYASVFNALCNFGDLDFAYDVTQWSQLVDFKKVTASDVSKLVR